jgi:hypothetical protein
LQLRLQMKIQKRDAEERERVQLSKAQLLDENAKPSLEVIQLNGAIAELKRGTAGSEEAGDECSGGDDEWV